MQYKKHGELKRVLLKAKYLKPEKTKREKRIEEVLHSIDNEGAEKLLKLERNLGEQFSKMLMARIKKDALAEDDDESEWDTKIRQPYDVSSDE